MIKQIPGFAVPSDLSTPIWRYMGFSKFVSLLDSRKLWFTRADLFDDKFEGTLPLKTAADWKYLAEWLFNQRERSYVSCWHANDYESAGMWKSYLGGEPGVVVESNYE